MKRNQKGFTLMEMLIVVAIIAVLVAVAIPVYTSQMHKVRVAADWDNVRAYYAQLQADYMLTGKSIPIKGTLDENGKPNLTDFTTITFLDGTKVKLQAGGYAVQFFDGLGYEITYWCNNNHENCSNHWGSSGSGTGQP